MSTPDAQLVLTTIQLQVADEARREELFHANLQVKQSDVRTIIDPGSQKNFISEVMVNMGLTTTPHIR